MSCLSYSSCSFLILHNLIVQTISEIRHNSLHFLRQFVFVEEISDIFKM